MGIFNHSKATVLSDIISEYAERSPERNALKDGRREYSFGQVEHKATRLAQLMVEQYQIRKGDRVVFIAEKACELIIGIIATWKAGAIYVPVDVKNGKDRTAFIVENVKPTVVISEEAALQKFGSVLGGRPTISYEQIAELSETPSEWTYPGTILPGDVAIILHTSGSTGNPKGVILEHQSTITYFHAQNELMQFSERSRNVNHGPYHFDVSVQDTFLPLYFGSSVYIYRGFLVSTLVINLMIQERITHLIAVSSVLALITGEGNEIERLLETSLEAVMTGGENCDVKLINKWLEALPHLRFYNGYGPSECNSLCMAYHIERPDYERTRLFPIGQAFTGTQALLVNDNHKVIEGPNKKGILCIGGPQLLRAYWNLPEETDKATLYIEEERYYITGDLASRDEAGNYYFEGRNDNEVKIFGRRINLNEIRNALQKNEEIDYAVVGTVEVEGSPTIFAYVYQSKERVKVDPERTAEQLRKSLPDYMVPKYLFVSDQLIKTSTNKINEIEIRKAVAAHILDDVMTKYDVLEELEPVKSVA
ncbi:MAG: AMP-binding protein [Bacteroidota bacterium]